MRAVVIAVKGSRAAVAFKGGALKYIEDKGYERGQILDIPYEEEAAFTLVEGRKKKHTSIFRFSSSAAAAASVLLLTGAVTAYAFPVSTVTIDVNPSLSMCINIFDRIVSAEYANEDGKVLLNDISSDLMGKKLPDAMNIVFDGMEKENYIDGPDIPAASTVVSRFPGKRNERVMEELRSSADNWNRRHSDRSLSFEVEPLTPDLRREALDKGMTPGQVMLQRITPEEIPSYSGPESRGSQEPPEYSAPEYGSGNQQGSVEEPDKEPDTDNSPASRQEGSSGQKEQNPPSQDPPPKDQGEGKTGEKKSGEGTDNGYKAPEERTPENRTPASPVPEEQQPMDMNPAVPAPEESAPQGQSPSEWIPEERAPEKWIPEERPQEEWVPEERPQEERAPEDREAQGGHDNDRGGDPGDGGHREGGGNPDGGGRHDGGGDRPPGGPGKK